MKKRFFQKVWSFIGAVVTLMALLASSGACYVILYQPKEPKCLRAYNEPLPVK